MTATKSHRLEARINQDAKETIAQAAALRGLSITDFVVQAALDKAAETIEAQQLLKLSKRDQELFVQVLMNPPQPNDALRTAAKLARDLIPE